MCVREPTNGASLWVFCLGDRPFSVFLKVLRAFGGDGEGLQSSTTSFPTLSCGFRLRKPFQEGLGVSVLAVSPKTPLMGFG